jgi:hypothetical protein
MPLPSRRSCRTNTPNHICHQQTQGQPERVYPCMMINLILAAACTFQDANFVQTITTSPSR